MITTPVLLLTLLLAVSSLPADDLELEARGLEQALIAPCCWRQPVSAHYSPAAEQVRSEIRRMLKEGRSREEILESFVSRHGERILAAPPLRGFHLLAYILPPAVLLLAALAVVRFLRSGTRQETTRPPPAPLGERYLRDLERAMRE